VQHPSVQAPSTVIQVSMSPPLTQHLNHLVTPTQSTWRHLARCHFSFWSHLKSCPKIIKKILKNQVTLLHHNPIKTIRVHPLDASERGHLEECYSITHSNKYRISQYQGVLLALIVHPILVLKTAGPNSMTTGPWQTLRERRENKCTWGDIRLATFCCPSYPNAKDRRP